MANYINVCGAFSIAQHHTCKLHNDREIIKCSGILKRGGVCSNNAKGPSTPGILPTCKIHRHQLKVSAICKAPVACGFECGRLFEWKPHGFQLCSSHFEDSVTCYFLKIPVELRCRIYQFLLPDRAVPARFGSTVYLGSDWKPADTAIFCVNHQLHEEATALLYGTRTFTIEVSENNLIMCNILDKIHCPQFLVTPTPFMLTPAIAGKPAGPIWNPPITEKYFTMIHSFRIELLFHHPINYKSPASSTPDADKRRVLVSRLARYNDQLRRLVERLRRSTLVRLEITIRFSNSYVESLSLLEAFSASWDLLNPFRCLCNIARPQVLYITANDSQNRQLVQLFPGRVSSAETWAFASNLNRWSKDLSSSQPSLKCDQVLEAYWSLENLLFSIKEHCRAEPRFFQFEELLQAARIARETNNLEHFTEIWGRVISIWFEYLDNQQGLQINVTRSIDAINGIVAKGY
ncbi:hypothetical protein V490_01366 [Pseudogymnoascus sp. VKM F-3557]|nr:hypothetical protein V490_01366 [Pseudogymnoascus sp. VKM F-3557]